MSTTIFQMPILQDASILQIYNTPRLPLYIKEETMSLFVDMKSPPH